MYDERWKGKSLLKMKRFAKKCRGKMFFYNISACTGGRLVCNSGVLATETQQSGLYSHAIVTGFNSIKRHNLLFLACANDLTQKIQVRPGKFAARFFPFYFENVTSSMTTTLYNSSLNKFLSAPPLREGLVVGDVLCNRSQAKEWEFFNLSKIDPKDVDEELYLQSRKLDMILDKTTTLESILDVIENVAADDLFLLDAVLALLKPGELRVVSSKAFNSEKILSAIVKIKEDRMWVDDGLVALKNWTLSRESSVSSSANKQYLPSGCDNKRELSSRFDGLYSTDSIGQYESFWHACNLTSRSLVKPRKKVCVVACARNEGLYISEWIAYHRLIGVDKFFIFSNNNDDGSDELLSSYANAGIIVWYNNIIKRSDVSPQFKSYMYAFSLLPDVLDYEWVLVVDIDEFFVYNPRLFSSLGEYLEWHELKVVDAIAVNWINIGPTGKRKWHNELLTRRFTHQVGLNGLVKSLFRPAKFCGSYCHRPETDERSSFIFRDSTGKMHSYQKSPHRGSQAPNFSDEPNCHFASIYHYYWKSAEEVLCKAYRNTGDQAVTSGIAVTPRVVNLLQSFMKNFQPESACEDNNIILCAPAIQSEIEKLLDVDGARKATSYIQNRYRIYIESIKQGFLESKELLENKVLFEFYKTMILNP